MVERHPHAVAWENWLMSEEGKKCATPTAQPLEEQYLRNRLWYAFMAGAAAALPNTSGAPHE